MDRTTKDIAWVAGILEGEGSFDMKRGTEPSIVLQMTDKDTVERVKLITGGNGNICEYPNGLTKAGVPCKNIFCYRMTGNFAIQWMMTLLCLMGKRRSEKIKGIITTWKDLYRYARVSNQNRNKRIKEYEAYKALSEMFEISFSEAKNLIKEHRNKAFNE